MNRRDFLSCGALGEWTLAVHPADPESILPAPVPPGLDLVHPPDTRRRRLRGEAHLHLLDLVADVMVAGGAMAGVWDYIRDSGDHPPSANWGIDWMEIAPGKRENRRLAGEHILTQNDRRAEGTAFPDAVAIGGWAHPWAASLAKGLVWIELAWDCPQLLRHIQIIFDTGFHGEPTLSASDSVTRQMVRGPQPETVRDYCLVVIDDTGNPRELFRVQSNYQRLRRHSFPPLKARKVRLEITATDGSPLAAIDEVRCYALRRARFPSPVAPGRPHAIRMRPAPAVHSNAH